MTVIFELKNKKITKTEWNKGFCLTVGYTPKLNYKTVALSGSHWIRGGKLFSDTNFLDMLPGLSPWDHLGNFNLWTCFKVILLNNDSSKFSNKANAILFKKYIFNVTLKYLINICTGKFTNDFANAISRI